MESSSVERVNGEEVEMVGGGMADQVANQPGDPDPSHDPERGLSGTDPDHQAVYDTVDGRPVDSSADDLPVSPVPIRPAPVRIQAVTIDQTSGYDRRSQIRDSVRLLNELELIEALIGQDQYDLRGSGANVQVITNPSRPGSYGYSYDYIKETRTLMLAEPIKLLLKNYAAALATELGIPREGRRYL